MKNIVHWCKGKKMWTSHTYKSCSKAPVVLIKGEWRTEVKPDRPSNPRGWVITDHTNVLLNPSEDALASYKKADKLFYNKEFMRFNIPYGDGLLFDEEGCHILQEVSR